MPDDVGRSSHWLKLERAQRHLGELNAALDRYSEREPYITERDPSSTADRLLYRARLVEQPGPELATVVGDVAHNLRCALDHIVAALAPPENRERSAFPIYTDDIWGTDASGGYVAGTAKQRARFQRLVEGIDNRAVTIIKACQPGVWPEPGRNVLTLLQRINNLDKHQDLTTVTTGLTDFDVVIYPAGDGRGYISDRFSTTIESGDVVARILPAALPPGAPSIDHARVRVQITGAALVAIKLPGYAGHFELRGLFEETIRVIGDHILPDLEGCLPGST